MTPDAAVVTIFPNKYAKAAREVPLASLLDTLRDPPKRRTKGACELFSLARYGQTRSEKGALRNDENVLGITGVAGDYDGQKVPIEQARDALALLGVRAKLYTSPRHKPDAPRWRVVCPCSKELPTTDHTRLMARLNGALGGVLAPESFDLSRSYFFGAVAGVEYVTLDTPGLCIDELPELDDFAIGKDGKPQTPGNGAASGRVPDAELRALLVRGVAGRIYPAMLTLSSRMARSGKVADDIVHDLEGLLNACEWHDRDPVTWKERLAQLPEMAGSAVRKYGPKKFQGGGVLLTTEKGATIPCEHNAHVLIEGTAQYAGLHFDEFLSRMRLGERDWIDADDLDTVRWLQSAHGVAKFTLGHARNAARSLAYSRRRDSLREFVESLPAWDGSPRVDAAFADAWGATDSPLIRAASRNFFVALIARALRPGAQVDTVWCFEGPQGSFKSRSLRELGGAFHSEITAPIGSPDFMRELRGLWIAELSELDSLRQREASTVKRLLSAPADRFVQKYALHAESYPRRAVAVATTNEANYWEDPTGARRLVPIHCGDIRVDLIAANRLQWFAEARHLFEQGATWWEFPSAIAEAQEDRQQVDPWEDTLRHCIAHGRRTGLDGMGFIPWPEGWISTADLMRDWLRLDAHQQGKASGVRLAKVMRRLGFRPERHGKERERGWIADTHDAPPWQVSA